MKIKDLGVLARQLNHKRIILRRFIKMLAKFLPCVSFNRSNHYTVASIYDQWNILTANIGDSNGLTVWGNPKANVSHSPILKAIDYNSVSNGKSNKSIDTVEERKKWCGKIKGPAPWSRWTQLNAAEMFRLVVAKGSSFHILKVWKLLVPRSDCFRAAWYLNHEIWKVFLSKLLQNYILPEIVSFLWRHPLHCWDGRYQRDYFL